MSGTRAEIVKLARLLGTSPDRFAYLADLPAADVRQVRERATDVLFDTNAAVFARIAAASKLVPAAITAAIAQRAFGPLLSARVAAALEPDRAVDLATRVTPTFLADVAAELDPRRIAPILTALPITRMRAVAAELIRRADYPTMGGFISTLPTPALRALIADLPAPAMLHIAIYSDDDTRFPEIFALIPDAKLADVVSALVDAEEPLATDIFELLSHLDTPGLSRLSSAINTLPEPARTTLSTRATTAGLTDLA